MKLKVYKIDWESTSDNFDNDGLVLGLSWDDENDNFIDVMWFSTEEERNKFFNQLSNEHQIMEVSND